MRGVEEGGLENVSIIYLHGNVKIEDNIRNLVFFLLLLCFGYIFRLLHSATSSFFVLVIALV